MPSMGSHASGNGRCKVHPRTPTACRACLFEGLREFRHASLRAGIHIATERVKKLRGTYLSQNGREEVPRDGVAVALTALLRELETSEKQVAELPVDASLIQLASRQASGHGAVARPS